MPLSSPVTDREIIICRDVDELSRKAAAKAATEPAARIKPSHGKLIWLITEDAAGDLRKG